MIPNFLNIETHGICTHFTAGVVSGVPHRVVLPNATHIQTQMVSIAGQGPILYYLVPHFPHIEVVGGPDLTCERLLRGGRFLTGVRLQVTNCRNLEFVNEAREAPGLLDYDPDYVPSADVVLQGRAACYLDVYGGTVSYHPPKRTNGAGFMSISMETDGPPELLVTSLAPWHTLDQVSTAYRFTLGESTDPLKPVTVKLRNVELLRELPADEHFGGYDFLLHYLTARGGIPADIVSKTPGMPKDPQQVQPERMAEALVELAKMVARAQDVHDPDAVLAALSPEDDLTSSCAPSQYP